MGLAIGNELELLTDHADARCIRESLVELGPMVFSQGRIEG